MNSPAPHSMQDEHDPKQLLTGKRACILDDEDAPITILEAYLSRYGVKTHSFNRAIPAMEYLKEDPPDVLLLDIMMPDMDGWVFYTSLRADPRLSDLPVLFVTCLADRELEREMEQDGLCATLSKPVIQDKLVDKLIQLIG